jgi:hypothetical protein
MYRQTFIPSEENNLIPFVVPQEWYGMTVEFMAFPVSEVLTENNNKKSYSYLQAEKTRQKQLIMEGKMSKPVLTDDVFTLEQEFEFNRKVTIDDIFQKR